VTQGIATLLLVALVPVGGLIWLLARRYEAARTAALDVPRSFVGWALVWAALAAAILALGVYILVPAWTAPVALVPAGFAIHAASRSARWNGVLAALGQAVLATLLVLHGPRMFDMRELWRSMARAHAIDRAMRAEAEDCIAGRIQCDDYTRGYFDRWEEATRGR
jgi:hypothetical protein